MLMTRASRIGGRRSNQTCVPTRAPGPSASSPRVSRWEAFLDEGSGRADCRACFQHTSLPCLYKRLNHSGLNCERSVGNLFRAEITLTLAMSLAENDR